LEYWVLERISFFPRFQSPFSTIPQLHHSIISLFHYSIIPSLRYSITPIFKVYNIHTPHEV
jgi:hypothetical protein